jgi:hypothetical protein
MGHSVLLACSFRECPAACGAFCAAAGRWSSGQGSRSVRPAAVTWLNSGFGSVPVTRSQPLVGKGFRLMLSQVVDPGFPRSREPGVGDDSCLLCHNRRVRLKDGTEAWTHEFDSDSARLAFAFGGRTAWLGIGDSLVAGGARLVLKPGDFSRAEGAVFTVLDTRRRPVIFAGFGLALLGLIPRSVAGIASRRGHLLRRGRPVRGHLPDPTQVRPAGCDVGALRARDCRTSSAHCRPRRSVRLPPLRITVRDDVALHSRRQDTRASPVPRHAGRLTKGGNRRTRRAFARRRARRDELGPAPPNPILHSPHFAVHILLAFAGYGTIAAGLAWTACALADRTLDCHTDVARQPGLAGLLLLGAGIITGALWPATRGASTGRGTPRNRGRFRPGPWS